MLVVQLGCVLVCVDYSIPLCFVLFFFLMIRRPPRSTQSRSSAASDVYKRQIQVWLKLSWPWTGAVVNILRDRGFFLGGILPRWFGEDGFLMQKILHRPNWEGISLHTNRAAQILGFIRNDWERTQTEDRT